MRNHAFFGGNKRAGLVTALVFLEWNGLRVPDGAPELFDLTVGVADGSITKDELTGALRRLTNLGG